MNPDSRFNVLNPIDGRFSNYTGFRADNSLASTILCQIWQNVTLNFINTIEIMKSLRPKNHKIIFESMKFNLKAIIRPTTVWLPFWIYWIHPSPKVMADFFQTQKLTWCPHPICTIFGGCIKCMQMFIFGAKYIDFLHQLFLQGGSKCGKRIFFQIKFEHHRYFPLKFVGFKWKFLNVKHDTFSLSHPNFLAIGLTVTKPSANKCRSLC